MAANNFKQPSDNDDDSLEEKVVSPLGTEINYVVRGDVGKASPASYPQKIRLGTVTAYDEKLDLALVDIDARTSPGQHSWATVNSRFIKKGSHVNIMGHTVGLWWTYISGYVSNTWLNVTGPGSVKVKAIQLSSAMWSGNSGGGAFDDDGNLIGVCSWAATNMPNVGFLIHRDEIVRFVQEHSHRASLQAH